jgi:hypothetical protein
MLANVFKREFIETDRKMIGISNGTRHIEINLDSKSDKDIRKSFM